MGDRLQGILSSSGRALREGRARARVGGLHTSLEAYTHIDITRVFLMIEGCAPRGGIKSSVQRPRSLRVSRASVYRRYQTHP